MDSHPRLHSCFDGINPQDAANDAQCMEILSAYTAVKVIGIGGTGIALLVTYTDDGGKTHSGLVVKLMENNAKTQKEIIRYCNVDRMIISNQDSNWAPMFNRTFGWTTCDSIPTQWKDTIQKHLNKNKLTFANIPDISKIVFCLVTPYRGMALWDVRFRDEIKCLQVVFELMYALREAYRNSNFMHNDLSAANVVYMEEMTTGSRNYIVRNRVYEIYGVSRITIIDFGHSEFTDEYHELYGYPRGVDKFLRSLKEFYPNFSFIDALIGADSFDQILTSDVFDVLILKEPPKPVGNMCFVCFREGTQMFQHIPSYKFCNSSSCVKKIGPIAHIIKKDL